MKYRRTVIPYIYLCLLKLYVMSTPFKVTEIMLNLFNRLPSLLSGYKYIFQNTSNGPLYSCKQFVCITNT